MSGRRLRGAMATERGSVVVEFLGLCLMLALPTAYALVAISGVQAASLAAVSAADQAAQAFAHAPDRATANRRAEAAMQGSLAGYPLGGASSHWSASCEGNCPGAGSTVAVTVTVRVPLPFMPAASANVGEVSSRAVVFTPRFG